MLWELIGHLANTNLSIRISGETGVGKQAIARLLYHHYPQENAKFLKIDSRELKIATAQSPMAELNKMLDAPQGFVLYLENVESMPEKFQAELLELLTTDFTSFPPWIVASSIQPLERFLHNGRFSIPLFKALDTVHINLPPLRSRPEKIPQILAWLLHHQKEGGCADSLTMPAMDEMEQLIDYHWPQNWRQLQKVARQAFERRDWNLAMIGSESLSSNHEEIDEIAAIYILSLARLSIQKDRVMEGFMAASNLDEIGLLDLAIVSEAVNQIAELMDLEDNSKLNYTS